MNDHVGYGYSTGFYVACVLGGFLAGAGLAFLLSAVTS